MNTKTSLPEILTLVGIASLTMFLLVSALSA